MPFVIKRNPTLTGGTSVTLVPMGVSPGQSMFVTPEHTRLAPRTVKFTSSPAAPTNAADPGVARSGLTLSYADRSVEEGCCTVRAGSVVFDTGVRVALSQPESLVDAAIADYRAVVNSDEFVTQIKKGINPNG